MTSSPALVIITVSKDNPEDLYSTIHSVQKQAIRPTRHIVVDSSIDRHQMAAISFEGEAEYIWTPANGVFSGMREGLSRLQGQEYCWFLNSGDLLIDDTAIGLVLEKIVAENQLPEWIVGATRLVFPSGRSQNYTVGRDYSEKELLSGEVWFPHPSTIYKVDSFLYSGALDGKLTIAEDYAASLRMLRMWGNPIFLDEVISAHFLDGISTTKPLLRTLEASKARIAVFGRRRLLPEFVQLLKTAIRALLNLVEFRTPR